MAQAVSAELTRGWIKRAHTLEDLAGNIGVDPEALQGTVTLWN
ncbi:hypothetical protein [Nisaea sediminum]|nr:hypothetical protein [Nisaea sediminum]